MLFASIRSSSSSTLTKFYGELSSSSIKMWSSLKIKLEKLGKAISANAISTILIHTCLLLYQCRKFVIKVNKIKGRWLVKWN